MTEVTYIQQLEIEFTFQQDFKIFNSDWDKLISQFNEECQKGEKALIQEHIDSITQRSQDLDKSLPLLPKYSPAYLSLTKSQDALAKKDKYKDAQVIKERLNEMV